MNVFQIMFGGVFQCDPVTMQVHQAQFQMLPLKLPCLIVFKLDTGLAAGISRILKDWDKEEYVTAGPGWTWGPGLAGWLVFKCFPSSSNF